jgi:hypothetical protein
VKRPFCETGIFGSCLREEEGEEPAMGRVWLKNPELRLK